MKIKFSKTYKVDTRWTVILVDFLATLSKAYGYKIDEFSVRPLFLDKQIDVLSKIPNIGGELFGHISRQLFADQATANNLRAELRKTYEALADSFKDEGVDDERLTRKRNVFKQKNV